MVKKLICIECPKGCNLIVNIKKGKVNKVSENQCVRGQKYAINEVEKPLRTLTATVLAEGLSVKLVPVKTQFPIPKAVILTAMDEIKKIRIKKPVCVGDIIVKNFLNSGVNLVATGNVFYK